MTTDTCWRLNVDLICRCSKHFPFKILLLIYNSYINSKLNYAIEAWGNAPQKYLNKLHVFQKKVMRILNKKPFDHPTTLLFKKCKILNIYQTYEFKITKRAHKQYYSDNISCQSLVTTGYSHFNLSLPPSTSAAGHRRTEFQVAKLWNSPPINLRAISDPIEFGRELRLHLLWWAAGVLSGWTS